MKLKKAKSTAAVLAALVLTSGFCGMSAEAATLIAQGTTQSIDGKQYGVTVQAPGSSVAAALDGQTLTNVTVDGYVTSESLNDLAGKLNAADNGMQTDIGALKTQVEKNKTNIDSLQKSDAQQNDAIDNATSLAGSAWNNATQAKEENKAQDESIGKLQEDVSWAQEVADNATNLAGSAWNNATQAKEENKAQDESIGKLQEDVSWAQEVADNATNLAGSAWNNATQAKEENKAQDESIGKLQEDVSWAQEVADNATNLAGSAWNYATQAKEENKVQDEKINTLQETNIQQNEAISKNASAIGDVSGLRGTNAAGEKYTNLADAVNGNLDRIEQNTVAIQQNSQAISSLGSRVSDLGDEIDNVGAISAALAGLHPLDYDGTGSKFQISAAVGTYDGSQAAALGAFYHFNRDVMLSLGGATAFDGDQKTAANLGVTFRVGAGASGKAVSDDVMARLEAMDQKIAALEQENKDLKNVLGAIDTSLSKEFPDVPANHWAYEAVTKLAGNDVVAGYPDGEFHGDRTMTRYEMAEVIYKAMQKGAKVDQKLVNEFKPEMEQVAANQNA